MRKRRQKSRAKNYAAGQRNAIQSTVFAVRDVEKEERREARKSYALIVFFVVLALAFSMIFLRADEQGAAIKANPQAGTGSAARISDLVDEVNDITDSLDSLARDLP